MKKIISIISLATLFVSCDEVKVDGSIVEKDTVLVEHIDTTVKKPITSVFSDTMDSQGFYLLISQGVKVFENKTVYGPLYINKLKGLTFRNCFFSSPENKDNPSKYVDLLFGKYVSNITVENCVFRKAALPICLLGDSLYIKNNDIKYFTHDAIRAIGNNVLIKGNTIKSPLNVNEWHRDGVQFYNWDEGGISNIEIDSNRIYNDTKNDSVYSTYYSDYFQGIVSFDGDISDVTVSNNYIEHDHYHGISLYNVSNAKVFNNVFTNSKAWIQMIPSKVAFESEVYNNGNAPVVGKRGVNDLSPLIKVM